MPPPTAQPVGRRGGGGCSIGASGLPGLKHHALMKGVSGIVMEQHESLRLKRSRGGISNGGATPSGMSPGGISSQTAASATAAPAGGSRRRRCRSSRRSSPQQQQQKASRCHFTFDFREPDQMGGVPGAAVAAQIRARSWAPRAQNTSWWPGFTWTRASSCPTIRSALGALRAHASVAGKILARYYRRGQQEVLLYVDRSEFEYYTPVRCCQPPNSPTGDSKRDGKRHSGTGKDNSSTSCFAIAGCAS
uniref:Histone ubiquitination proteins group n=1 Tax=Macrostomum lignano TaxID=282301 RepID=A0A1I8H9I9_9PLAT